MPEVKKVELTPEVVALLTGIGLTTQSLEDIAKWDTFVDMLNKFVSEYTGPDQEGTGLSGAIQPGNGGGFNPGGGFITIPVDNTAYGQHSTVLTLAHELTHALSQVSIDYSSAENYAKSVMLMEGEAFYNKMVALSILYPAEYSAYSSEPVRNDNLTYFERIDFFNEVHKIITGFDKPCGPDCLCKENTGIFNDPLREEKIKEIAEKCLNLTSDSGLDMGKTGIDLTYDERYKWQWLKLHTDIAIDYLEAVTQTTYKRNDEAARKDAYEEIEASPDHMRNIRVLLNKAHEANTGSHYFGTDANDTLKAEENGSALGVEVLWGGKGHDILIGSHKKDILLGGDDEDILRGQGGDDLLLGNAGHDILEGGDGEDTLYGDSGSDDLRGGDDQDKLYGGQDNDVLEGGEGADYLEGGAGEDIYIIDPRTGIKQEGDVIVDSDGGKIWLRMGEEQYVALNGQGLAVPELGLGYYRDANNGSVSYHYIPDASGGKGSLRILYNGACVATIEGYDPASNSYGITLEERAVQAKPGVIDLSDNEKRQLVYIDPHGVEGGSEPGITVKTGSNYDTILGSKASEIIESGDGADYVQASGGSDFVYGGAGMDYLVGDGLYDTNLDGNDHIVGGADSDQLIGGGGNDILIAGSEANESGHTEKTGDMVAAGSGDDTVFGSRDRDILDGGLGRDIIRGNGGDDYLSGDGDRYMNRGSFLAEDLPPLDKYQVSGGGQSKQEINDADYMYGTGIWWADKYTPHPSNPDLPFGLSYSTTTGTDGYSRNNGYKNPLTGTNWVLDARARSEIVAGLCDDQLFGGEGDDEIAGMVGSDLLDGGSGSDIMFGDGNSWFREAGITLTYTDGTSAEGDDSMFGGTGSDYMFGDGGNDKMYADQSFVEGQIIPVNQFDDAARAGDGFKDFLYGGRGHDIMVAGTGGDELYGEANDDTLYADIASNATLDGGENNDTLVIGSGSGNIFKGGSGMDTYAISRAALSRNPGTVDTVEDSDGLWSLELEGIKVGSPDCRIVWKEDRWVVNDMFELILIGNDLHIKRAGMWMDDVYVETAGKTVIIKNAYGQTGFEFLNLPQENQNPEISASLSDLRLVVGQAFSYRLPLDLFGDPAGANLLYSLSGSNGHLPSWLRYDAASHTLSGTVPAQTGTIKLTVSASDGQNQSEAISWNLNVVSADSFERFAYKLTDGEVELSSQDSDSVISLSGIRMANIILGRWQSADGQWDDLVIDFVGNSRSRLTIKNYFKNGVAALTSLCFDSGELWNSATIAKRLAEISGSAPQIYGAINGTAADDWLKGTREDNIIEGGAGHDTIRGEEGRDILRGGAGNDKLTGGNDDDEMYGGADDDTYAFFHTGSYDYTYGHDIIDNAGGGNDAITFEYIDTSGLYFEKAGDHLIIKLVGTDDQVTVKNWFAAGDNKIDRIEVAGLTLTAGQVEDLMQAMASVGLPAGDYGMWTAAQLKTLEPILARFWKVAPAPTIMAGTEADDTMYNYAPNGNQSMYGLGGNDIMSGNSGDNEIFGGSGNDYLAGAEGNDKLDGEAGDDVYALSSGQDIIINTGGGNDTLDLGAYSEAYNFLFKRSGDNLVISTVGSSDTMTIQNWYAAGDYKIDIVANGLFITADQVDAWMQALATVGKPSSYGGWWSERFGH